MNGNELMTFKVEDGNLIITIPTDFLMHVAQNHPEFDGEINDEQSFAVEFKEELESGFEGESGLTRFQELMDDIAMEIFESGSEYIDYNEE